MQNGENYFMIKVLHIIQGYGGGVSSLIRNLIVASDKSQIKQDVMSFTHKNGEEVIKCIEENNSKTFLMPRPRVEGYKKFKNYVFEVMKNGNYDVVHCHSDGWRSSVFRKLSVKAGIKLFCVHAHRTSNNPGFIINNSLYLSINRYISRKNADIIFTCGTDAAKFIFGDCQYTTIPNGIDLTKCDYAASLNREHLRNQLSVQKDELLLFHAGRFVVQKNHDFIIKLAESLKNNNIKFKILLAGAGDLEKQIKELIKSKSLENHVILLGRRNDIYELMHAADCVILPSTSEGLPTVVMESQIMGTPCCASDRVTTECDLKLGLVKFLSINSTDEWLETLTSLNNFQTPSRDEIIKVFTDNAYTSVGSATRYLNTLKANLQKI